MSWIEDLASGRSPRMLVTEDGEWVANSTRKELLKETRKNFMKHDASHEYTILPFYVNAQAADRKTGTITKWSKTKGFSLWRK